MRLLRLPRFNAKREVWPGGPQIGQVIEAQLSPPAGAQAVAVVDGDDDETMPEKDRRAIELLLLLR